MHAPYRIATPPEPIRTDEADNYEQTLVAERTRERIVGAGLALAGITVATIAVMTLSTLSHHDRHEADARARVEARITNAKAIIADADHAAIEAQSQFEAAVTYELLANWNAPQSLSPCSVDLASANRFGRSSLPLLVLSGPSDRDLPSPSVARIESDVHRARELLATGYPAEAILYAEALAAVPPAERLVRDVVLVPRKHVAPTRTSATSFTPGVLEGTAYLYDFRQHAVICAGEIHAESSRAIEYSYNDGAVSVPKSWEHQAPRLDATLDGDLDAQITRAIALPGALRAITR